MFFKCGCGNQFHMSVRETEGNVLLNMSCYNCFKDKVTLMYKVEYILPGDKVPKFNKLFAPNEIEVSNILKTFEPEAEIINIVEIK